MIWGLCALLTVIEIAGTMGLFLWMRKKGVSYRSKKFFIVGLVAGLLLFATWAVGYALN
jgi:hypothetical protein